MIVLRSVAAGALLWGTGLGVGAAVAHAQSVSGAVPAVAKPSRTYDVIIGAEAVDKLQVVRFGPSGAAILRERVIGKNGMDPDGPHGVGVSPDGRYYYVSTAHGNPDGTLWKLETETDKVLGQTELGSFPATVQVSADAAQNVV